MYGRIVQGNWLSQHFDEIELYARHTGSTALLDHVIEARKLAALAAEAEILKFRDTVIERTKNREANDPSDAE